MCPQLTAAGNPCNLAFRRQHFVHALAAATSDLPENLTTEELRRDISNQINNYYWKDN